MSRQQNDKFFWGKGMWIWELAACEGGNIDAIVAKAKDVGLSWVVIKAWDGASWVHPQFTSDVVNKFHAANILCYAWGYCYGGNTLSEEIRLANVSIDPTKLNADGVIYDCEDQFFNQSGWARSLCSPTRDFINQMVSEGKDRKLMALSSYGDPTTQSKEPYKDFLDFCDVYMPQAYFNAWIGQTSETPDTALYDLGYSEWLVMAGNLKDSMRPIIPTLPTYQEYGYNLTSDKLKQAMDYLNGYHGINFWSWQHTATVNQDLWNLIKGYTDLPFVGYDYGQEVVPAPQPTPAPVQDTWTIFIEGANWYTGHDENEFNTKRAALEDLTDHAALDLTYDKNGQQIGSFISRMPTTLLVANKAANDAQDSADTTQKAFDNYKAVAEDQIAKITADRDKQVALVQQLRQELADKGTAIQNNVKPILDTPATAENAPQQIEVLKGDIHNAIEVFNSFMKDHQYVLPLKDSESLLKRIYAFFYSLLNRNSDGTPKGGE